MASISLQTHRLQLRPWRDADLVPFAALNADPRVMEYFPDVQSKQQSEQFIERMHAHFAEHGFGFWAAEVLESNEFAGFIGLGVPSFKGHFTPCVEIGWRLAANYWGRGYATEGARESLRFGFEQLGLHEIVSFTSVTNQRSRRVMEKIGMTHNPTEDFDHPALAKDDPLQRHVLYRLTSESWKKNTAKKTNAAKKRNTE